MFSLRHFVRKTPASSLRAYLLSRHQLLPEIAWEDDRRDWLDALVSFVEQLPRTRNEQIHVDFEEVHQLCDEFGQRALRTMFEGDQETFDALDGAEARGLYVLTGDPIGFKRALSVAYSERLYHGRSWSRYYASQVKQPSDAPEAKAAFEADLKELFGRTDGSGRHIMIETFERPAEGSPSLVVSIFVESLPQSMVEFSENVPQRTTRRPVVEAALAYNPTEGVIDIVAKGGRGIRDEIGEAFVHHLLGADTELLPVSPRTFDLDRLRRPIVFATDPEDGIEDVSVTALRLRDLTDMVSRITLETSSSGQGIHKLAEQWFGGADRLMREPWRVEQAKLQIMFHPERDGGRNKRVTIELRAPNGSNLKEQIRRHDLISSKYLSRWGLLDAGQP